MGRTKKILIGAFAVLLLVGLIGGYALYDQAQGFTRAAFLNIHEGSVFFDTGSGWKIAGDGMELSLGDKVKTDNGIADVILFESVIVSLDTNTVVSISSLAENYPKIALESGSVWNKFTGLVGVDHFDVETPTTVATVRGTEFGVSFIDSIAQVIVAEGLVDVSADGETLQAAVYERVTKIVGQALQKDTLTPEDIEQLRERRARILQSLKKVRDDEIKKNGALLKMAGAQGIDESKIQQGLDDVDAGVLDDKAVAAQITGAVPFEVASVDKVLALNQVIKDQMRELEQD
jgi:hypothetical protein